MKPINYSNFIVGPEYHGTINYANFIAENDEGIDNWDDYTYFLKALIRESKISLTKTKKINNFTKCINYYLKFPEPYKSQAIFNINHYKKDELENYNINNIKDSLKGFNWDYTKIKNTKECWVYWYLFEKSLI